MCMHAYLTWAATSSRSTSGSLKTLSKAFSLCSSLCACLCLYLRTQHASAAAEGRTFQQSEIMDSTKPAFLWLDTCHMHCAAQS